MALIYNVAYSLMKYSKLIFFILIALVVHDSFMYLSYVGALSVNNATLITTVLSYCSLAIMIFLKSKTYEKENIPFYIRTFYKIWIIWLVFSLIRGAFLAEDYWEWKLLFLPSFSFTLIPLAYYLGQNLDIFKLNVKFILKYLYLFGFIFIPVALVTNDELYSRLMISISLFILFIPFLDYKWKLLIVIVAVTSMVIVIDFRSNIIKNFFSFGLITIFYFRKYIGLYVIRFFHLLLFIVPIVLFSLALSGKYNIFAEIASNEGYTTINNEGEEEDLTFDSRTFLYTEVLLSVNNSGNWLIGKSAIGSYMTDYFYDEGGAMNGKRFGCEVGILNIFLRYGLIGVISYFLLLFIVSWKAVNNSSNFLSKMIGLFIAFRFTYSFIEEFTQYDTNFYIFYVAIGLVSASSFRNMSDEEIKNFFKL